ncbi:MAG: TVP38/TMEM64 family protein [Acaryochloridaceae cyanobacterium SU_2_1]|nr:TVP38/TMEM64 family protein [Acaryochloridaceae cyanobacterium SU_2_1]
MGQHFRPSQFSRDPQPDGTARVTGRTVALVALLAIVLLPLLLQLLPILLDQMRLVDLVQSYGLWGSTAFVGLHILATIIGVPGGVLTVVGGLLYGLVWGSLWSLLGATLGALAAFWLVRHLARDRIERWLGEGKRRRLFNAFDQAIHKNPWSFVLLVRFAPIAPFNLINYLFGITQIHWLPYGIGTLIGIIPGVMAYTWLGVAGNQAMHGQTWPLVAACCLLAGMSALPLLLKRKSAF